MQRNMEQKRDILIALDRYSLVRLDMSPMVWLFARREGSVRRIGVAVTSRLGLYFF